MPFVPMTPVLAMASTTSLSIVEIVVFPLSVIPTTLRSCDGWQKKVADRVDRALDCC